MTMSPVTLKRCRQLRITKEGDYTILEVFDPRTNQTPAKFRARTPHDVERVKRAFMKDYRIPKECVVVTPETVQAPVPIMAPCGKDDCEGCTDCTDYTSPTQTPEEPSDEAHT